MTACGVWPSRRGLVAVIVDVAGRRLPHTHIPDASRAARYALIERIVAAQAALVVDEALVAFDPLIVLAHRAGVTIWVTGPPLLPSLRHAAGMTTGPPQATAALLARIPAMPRLLTHMRRIGANDDPRQLRLL